MRLGDGRFSEGALPFRTRPITHRDSRPARARMAEGRFAASITGLVVGMRLRLRGRRSAMSNAWRGRSWRPVARSIPILVLGATATWVVLVSVGLWAAVLMGAGTFVTGLATLTSRRAVLPPRARESKTLSTPGRRPKPWT
jgi:hypothetical protein